jgi:cysteine desulfurase/selenocysteine lyase
LDVDFLVFSGHKLFGPTGVGVLFGKAKHLEIMPPMFGGGDMIKSVSFSSSVFADPPARFEAGTPDIAAVIGLGAAIDFVTQFVGFEWIQNHEALLCKHAKSVLRDIPGLNIIGQAHERVPVFSFVLDAIHPHDLGTILDQHGIAVRTGHHCAQPLLEAMGAPSTARMSLSIYNTVEDIDSLVKGLWRAKELFA